MSLLRVPSGPSGSRGGGPGPGGGARPSPWPCSGGWGRGAPLPERNRRSSPVTPELALYAKPNPVRPGATKILPSGGALQTGTLGGSMHRLALCTALCALLSTHAPAASLPAEPDMRRPLDWLIAAQNDDGSWGDGAKDPHPDVATTALAGLALARLGHTGSRGEYQERTRRGGACVASAGERAPQGGIAINPPRTLPQRKVGRHIDTFLAAQFLAAVLPTPPGPLQARAER